MEQSIKSKIKGLRIKATTKAIAKAMIEGASAYGVVSSKQANKPTWVQVNNSLPKVVRRNVKIDTTLCI